MAQGKRITLTQTRISDHRTIEERNRKFVLVLPPFPEIGDTINHGGEEWQVTKVEDTEILARIPIHKRQKPLQSPTSPQEPSQGAQGQTYEGEGCKGAGPSNSGIGGYE